MVECCVLMLISLIIGLFKVNIHVALFDFYL